jgi:hypothetical protein
MKIKRNSFLILIENKQMIDFKRIISSNNTYVQTIWTGEYLRKEFVNKYRKIILQI